MELQTEHTMKVRRKTRKTRTWAVLAQAVLLLPALLPDLSLVNQRQYYLLQIHLYSLVVLPFLSVRAVACLTLEQLGTNTYGTGPVRDWFPS